MTTSNRKDCYTEITNAIIGDLEKGIRPWARPWDAGTASPCRPLRNNGEPYRGINVLWLWRAAHLAGYTARIGSPSSRPENSAGTSGRGRNPPS